MVIYIAHGTPRHNDLADRAGVGIGAGSEQTRVVRSHDFDRQGKAVARDAAYVTRDLALTDAGRFLVLMPPADTPVIDVSIGVELGIYLEIRRKSGEPAKIICLHHPEINPSEIVAQCAPEAVSIVPGNESAVRSLIGQLYPTEKREALIQTMLNELLAAVGAGGIIARYATAPTLTIAMTEEELPQLGAGHVPADAVIGGHRWETLLGQEDRQAGLPWSVVRQTLQDPDGWEPILAEELDFVRQEKKQREAVPILLHEKTGVPPVSAVAQRYEIYPGTDTVGRKQDPSNVHRFTLATFQAPMLYNAGDTSPLANAFHLATVAQLYRFMVIDRDVENLQAIRALVPAKAKMKDFHERVTNAIGELRRHTLLIGIETRRRNFLGRLAKFEELLYQAYGVKKGEKLEVDAKQTRLSSIMPRLWLPLSDQLEDAIKRGEAAIDEMISTLQELGKLNADVITISADCYARLATQEYVGA